MTAAILAGAAVLLLAGCTTIGDTIKNQLMDAVKATQRISRTYVYTESAGSRTTAVTATVADDLHYGLDATVNGKPAAGEVVSADQRALQVMDTTLGKGLLASNQLPPVAQGVVATPSPTAAATASPSTSAGASTSTSISVGLGQMAATSAQAEIAAVEQGKWILDVKGNTGFVPLPSDRYVIGSDPLYDSLTVLNHIVDVINQGAGVQVFSPEAPGYRSDFDPFPQPNDKQNQVRYDITPPVMPVNQTSTVQSLSGLPRTPNFRRAAVYIVNGLVVAYREQVSVSSMLADPRSFIADRISGYGITLPTYPNLTVAQQAAKQAPYLLGILNRDFGPVRGIRESTLDVEFSHLGSTSATPLPSDSVAGDLSLIGNHGLVLYEKAT